MNKRIYLDHAATTFADEAVICAMAQCMRESAFNASAAYSAAGLARKVHRSCRAQLGAMLSCSAQEIFFTSGGTEGNNQVIRSFAGAHIVLSAIEHHSVLDAAKAAGCRVTLAAPDASGRVSPQAVADALESDTKLIALMAANNETGVLQPYEAVYALAQEKRIHLHVDAVQAFGHTPVSSRFCDSMALSAHKLCGPRGVGALYIRTGAPITPLLFGGSQQSGLRPGTENTPAICGFDAAARLAAADMDADARRERALLDAFTASLLSALPLCRLLGADAPRLPNIAALCLPCVSSEEMIAALDTRGILVSGGAACATGSAAPSHVYTAMGLSAQEAKRVIRVSIGKKTTAEELSSAAEAIIDVIRRSSNQSIFR